jgi:flavin reductase ActVB
VVPLAESFRDALASFPSGVTVVTTIDGEDTPRGFTATAFASVSAEPPKILVCLSRSAECFAAFDASERFCVNILADHHHRVARTFASRGADKFGAGSFGESERGMPVLEEAVAFLDCEVDQRIESGDHTVLIGDVVDCVVRQQHRPLVYFRRAFHDLGEVGSGRS